MDEILIPVKILDKKWANKFLDGEIFMRSLSDFGVWNRFKNLSDPQLNNSFRGDLLEGALKTCNNATEDAYFNELPDSFKNAFITGSRIDYDNIQYFNLFCLYCYKFFPLVNKFEEPSLKLNDFGDSAVIITNTNIFLNRFLEEVERTVKYECMINKVDYYIMNETKNLNPLFNKSIQYSWQNELRIAVGRLDLKRKLKDGGYPLIKSDAPLKLKIGSIRDIAMIVPTKDFICGNWDKSRLRYAVTSDNMAFLNDLIIQSKEKMKKYKPNKFNGVFTIG